MKKVITRGKIVRVGSQQISWSEFKNMYRSRSLMALCYNSGTMELMWQECPDWWFLIRHKNFTLYCVEDQNKRIEKTFKPLPVNSRLPYCFVEMGE
jgi:hypothetical protein